MNEVLLVPTGIANIASVTAAFARLGTAVRSCVRADELRTARAVVLPGVGAFAAGMQRLTELGLVEVLAERVRAGRGTLAVCLGMQLCCEASEESPGVKGLAVVPGTVRAFPPSVRSPHLGWNRVDPVGEPWCESGFACFANGYRLATAPPGWSVATTEHGGPFVSALRRRGAWLCQLHPELSGRFGEGFLRAFLQSCCEEVAC